MDRPIYLDHAATTPPLPAVVERMIAVQRDAFGNPSSRHRFGSAARKVLEDSREFLRGSVGAAQLVFTSGGTEADLLGVFGAALARRPGRVLVGAADHPAVLSLDRLLAARRHQLVPVPVSEHGDLVPEVLFDAMGPDVGVVSILHGHNELGTLADLAELVSVVRHVSPDTHVHVDLVQGYGKIDFDLDLAGVDSIAVSGHKLHGPRGVGFLALSSKAKIAPLQTGGGQEEGLRGGTENVAGAAGLAVAAEHMLSHLADHAAHTERLAAIALAVLRDEFPDVTPLGHPSRRLPHILSMRIPGVEGSALQRACDARGVAFSTGAACHDGGHGSPTLRAIGLPRLAAAEVVRLSFAAHTTEDDLDRALGVMIDEIDRLRARAPAAPSG